MDYSSIAIKVFEIESQAVLDLSKKLNSDFDRSIRKIIDTSGRVIICGMGKSGIIGKKIAATLASTGTPSFFMHPGEAFHGDLGMVTSNDVFIAISNSGETDEVLKLIPFLKDNGNFIISLTGSPSSTLALSSDSHLNVGVSEEACPLKLAPTSSTTATLAMGDALAVTLMKARNFQPENFARFHPGGSLGRRLLSRVSDEMYSENLPFIDSSASSSELISVMTEGRLGIAIVQDANCMAIVTDGDVRRSIEIYNEKFFSKRVSDLMTSNPQCISSTARVEDALVLMEASSITTLLVTEGSDIVGVFKK
ncbi:KpsF/GutQ family sugar-phosphate isomerase [Aliamphritea spongicola]|uniref:KpsF/GutQ family sugar-phosphate isomerase n=1 Tax=Aliamphritea spongicola TaxID=707589 RepID=UPI00196A6C8A|nr:KpsF/GutQ family sugar-phosphate isomerase [Aliamphritea spongicola]MBN3560954.1 KpsF/GutQ family sugar-phosphate isomerase [Aliamphritea spongicola]